MPDRDEELASGAPRADILRVPLQRGVVALERVLPGARLLEDLRAAVPEAGVQVVDRDRLLEASEGPVVLLRELVDGRLPRPGLHAVRGEPEGPVERVERIVRLLLAGVRLRLPDPPLRVLRGEAEELVVVVRVVRRERRDLVIGGDRLVLLPRCSGGVPPERPQGGDLGGGLQGPVERGEGVLRLAAGELEEPLDLERVRVPGVERERVLGGLPGGRRVRETVVATRDLPVDGGRVRETSRDPGASVLDRAIRSRDRPVRPVLPAAVQEGEPSRRETVRLPQHPALDIEEVR